MLTVGLYLTRTEGSSVLVTDCAPQTPNLSDNSNPRAALTLSHNGDRDARSKGFAFKIPSDS